MEGDPGGSAHSDSNTEDEPPAKSARREEPPGATTAPVAVRSSSRIPLPTGELAARSAMHLAALVANPGPPPPPTASSVRAGAAAGASPSSAPGPPGGLPVLTEGGSSLQSPAAASPVRRLSEELLDQCDHTPLDIRDSGDCAGMGGPPDAAPSAERAQGDADGYATPPTTVDSFVAASPSASVLIPDSAPHALLVQAVCSRSHLAATQSGDRLAVSPATETDQSVTTTHAFASEVYLSTCTSLDLGPNPDNPMAKVVEEECEAGPRIPALIVTAATPPDPDPEEAPQAAPPQAQDLTTEPAGAPPPPPCTPALESEQPTPDRKTSPVRSQKKVSPKTPGAAASKTPSKIANNTATKTPATPRRQSAAGLSAAGLSSSRHGGSTGNVGAVAGRDREASVTLIKAPKGSLTLRPASARSARSATTTGTVTSPSSTAAKRAPAITKPGVVVPFGASHSIAAKSASATVNRKVSKDPVTPRLDLSATRPKLTQGPNSARGKPSRELTSLSGASDGAASRVDSVHSGKPGLKQEALASNKKASTTTYRLNQNRVSADGMLASGAGEDIAALKTTEDWSSCLARLDEGLSSMSAPYLVLVTELVSRHAVLLDALKDKDPAAYAEGAQFAATLANRQSEALKMASQQAGAVQQVVRAKVEEETNMRALLASENTELVRRLAECTRDLESERAASAKSKAAKVAQESSVKQMRARITELEGKMAVKSTEDEAKLKDQSAQVTQLKEKLRARKAVLDQRTKDLEAAQARIADLMSSESVRQKLDSRLGSMTQMLQIETKTREKAEQKLKTTTEKLSQMAMSRGDAELEEIRAERDKLKEALDELTIANSRDMSELRDELKNVMEQLESRSRQLEDKDAELRHYLALRPGEPTREEVDKLKETFAQLATHNDRLEQELSKCRQELAQRDKIMTEQENVLRVRDNLLKVLGDQQHLQGHGPVWPQEAVDGGKLIETFATLERKSVRLKACQQQIQQLERDRESWQVLRTHMETRIAQLEHLVIELKKSCLGNGKQCAPRFGLAM